MERDDEILTSQTVGSLKDCAELTARTPGGLFWIYDENQLCRVKKAGYANNALKKTGSVAGNRECKFLTSEEWEREAKKCPARRNNLTPC